MEAMWRDIALSIRALRRSPIFTIAAVLTLALGVAVNVAVFSVVNALLLRPLPVRDGDRLVVPATKGRAGPALGGVSFPDLQDYRAATPDVFEDVAAYSVGFVGLTVDGYRPARVLATWVTGDYFPLLGLEASRGRLIAPVDAHRGPSPPVVVLGYTTWERRFDGNPAVVGTAVRVNGRLYIVAGVAPAGFRGTFAFSDSELYLPVSWLGDEALENRASRSLHTRSPACVPACRERRLRPRWTWWPGG